MGGGTDMALETADGAEFTCGWPMSRPWSTCRSRTMTNNRQNIVIGLRPRIVFLVTTIVGLTGF